MARKRASKSLSNYNKTAGHLSPIFGKHLLLLDAFSCRFFFFFFLTAASGVGDEHLPLLRAAIVGGVVQVDGQARQIHDVADWSRVSL